MPFKSVYLPGFFRRSQKIHVEKGFTLHAQFKLALDKSHKTLEEELEEKQKESSLSATPKVEEKKTEQDKKETTLKIKETPTGFLNVRSEASVNGEIVDKVDPGETFNYTAEQDGWYKITLSSGEEGWVSGEYIEKL